MNPAAGSSPPIDASVKSNIIGQLGGSLFFSDITHIHENLGQAQLLFDHITHAFFLGLGEIFYVRFGSRIHVTRASCSSSLGQI